MTAPHERRAVIAFGSNLGDRAATIRDAVAALEATAEVSVRAVSPLLETVAVTLEGADESKPSYLNAVALVDTTLEPEPLLDVLERIERDHGRVRVERWGDRTLDLDIIDFSGLDLHTERLTLPHPRAAERDFVLRPWLSVDPDAVLRDRGPVADLLAALDAEALAAGGTR